MASNRSRRDKKKAQKEHLGGNAVRIEGRIEAPGVCRLEVLVANPSKLTVAGGIGPSDLVPIHAIIDTGATSACISKALAAHLELTPHGRTQVSVVGGSTDLDQAPMLLGFLNAEGILTSKVVPVAIGDIPVPMLFGMSELMPGTLTINGAAGTWEWKVPNSTLGQPNFGLGSR